MQENDIHNQVGHQLPSHCQATTFKSENFIKSWKNNVQIRKPQKLLNEKTFKKKVAFKLWKNVHMKNQKTCWKIDFQLKEPQKILEKEKEKKRQDKTRQDSQNDWDLRSQCMPGKKPCCRYPQVLCHVRFHMLPTLREIWTNLLLCHLN